MVHSYSANKELVLTEDVCPVIFSFIGFPGAALMQRFPQWRRVLGESQMPWTHIHLWCTQCPSPSSTFIPSAWSISMATFPAVICVPWSLKLPFTFHGVFPCLFSLTSVPVCEVVVGPKACRVLVPLTELQCGLNALGLRDR